MLGQHSDRILEDLLALGDDEISALRTEKVIG